MRRTVTGFKFKPGLWHCTVSVIMDGVCLCASPCTSEWSPCESMERAAANGHMHCLESWYTSDQACNDTPEPLPYFTVRRSRALDTSINYGHLQCVKFLHQQGVPWTAYSMKLAAISRSVEVIKYLHESGVPWDNSTTGLLVREDHLAGLMYAFEHGAPWYPRMTALAAKGHLQCLEYAHEHGAPWDECTMNYAFSGNHLDCLRYAFQNGCIWNAEFQHSKSFAYDRIDLECLKFADECGGKWSEHTTTSAAHCGQSDCLQYLVERGCRYTAMNRDIQKHREVIAIALGRRRSTVMIQRAWRAAREATKRKAVSVIENAYMTWSCRPGAGGWYKRSLESFQTNQVSQTSQPSRVQRACFTFRVS